MFLQTYFLLTNLIMNNKKSYGMLFAATSGLGYQTKYWSITFLDGTPLLILIQS